jgi:FxsC-like protein
LPKLVQDLQFEDDAALGAAYAENGLMVLLRVRGEAYESAYQKFLIAIAGRIAAAAKTPPPRLAKTPPYAEIASAFHPSVSQPPSRSAPAVKGVKSVWLVYAAGAEREYPATRTERGCYGASGGEWQPFLPEADALVGAIATNVASGRNLYPQAVAVSPSLITQLQDAEDTNTMAVIIVDPWSIEITPYESAIRALDRARLTNCGVIVVWNSDIETQGREGTLKTRLQQLLSRTWISRDVYFQDSVRSEDQLRTALAAALEDLRLRISARGRLLRGEKPDGSPELPKLPAPGAASASSSSAATLQ